MSFAGALGQGLLSAVSGGAGAYVDETKRQVARDDAAAEREKLMRLQDEITAARQRAVEEEKRKRAEIDQKATAERRHGYIGKADGLLSSQEDFKFDMGNTNEGTPMVDDVAAAGPVKSTVVDKYSRYSKAAELAALDGREEDAKTLASLAGKSPAEIRKGLLDQGKTIAEIKKIESDIENAGNYTIDTTRFNKNNERVAYVPKEFAPDRSADSRNKPMSSADLKLMFTSDKTNLAYTKEDVLDKDGDKTGETRDVLRPSGKVAKVDNTSMNAFIQFSGGDTTDANYSRWLAAGAPGASASFRTKLGGGNKQTLEKTSGNMPAKQRSLKDIFGR